MKNVCLLILLFLSTTFVFAEEIDFTKPVGFAAQNGGTTGGEGAEIVRVYNYDQFVAAVVKKEKDLTPRYVEVAGLIEYPGGAIVQIGSNTTIRGVGTFGKFSQISLYIKNATNVIIQNVTMTALGSNLGSDSDLISIATTSSGKNSHIWIDHCEFYNEKPIRDPSASLKDKYDGLIDIKKTSEYITVSWCYFHDHYKAVLIGYTTSDTYDRKITIHHNIFERINSRTPSLRGGTSHIYNNLYIGTQDEKGWFGSGANLRENSTSKIEGNAFYGMSNTIYHADTKSPGTFCGEDNYVDENSSPVVMSIYKEDTFTPPYDYKLNKSAELTALLVNGVTVGVGVINNEIVEINEAPVVEITSPEEESNYDITKGAHQVEVTAIATDSDGEVTKVEFYLNDKLVDEVTEAPYKTTLQIEDFKVYKVFAKAYDNKGGVGYSELITIKGVKYDDEGNIIEPTNPGPADIEPGDLIFSDDLTAGSTVSGVWVSSNSGLIAEDPSKCYPTSSDKNIKGYIKVKKTVTLPEVSSCGKIVLQMRASNTRDLYVEKLEEGVWTNVATINVSDLGLYELTEEVATLETVQYRISGENEIYLYNVEVYAGEEIEDNGSGGSTNIEESTESAGEIVNTTYYNLSGMVVKEPLQNTIYIQEDIYEDGTIKRSKILIR